MQDLFQNVLTASFHGSIVILAVIALRAVLKKTPKKFLCFLWLLAGLRLLMPFEIQSSFSLQPEPVQIQEQIQEQQWIQLPYTEPLNSAAAHMSAFSEAPSAAQTAPQPNTHTVSAVTEAAQPQAAPQAPQTSASTQRHPFVNWQALVPYFWLSITVCFGVYVLYCYLHLSYQVREAIKIPGGWECDRIETAFILGFIRPRIYIPMGTPRGVRKYILAHERTHLEKGDHWFKMVGFLALAIHWFNPLVWVAYALLCKDIEMACDERVVQFMDLEERKAYSAALLNCSTNRAHFAACPVAFGEVSVKNRIKSVLNYRKPGFWISLAGVAAIFFVALCLLTNPTEKPPAAGDTPTAETMETAEPEGHFTDTLTTNEEIQAAVQNGLQALMDAPGYCIDYTGEDTLTQSGEPYTTACTYYRSGDNLLCVHPNASGDGIENGFMLADGVYYDNYGQYWEIPADPWHSYRANDWLEEYSLEKKSIDTMEVSFPEGSGVLDGSTVSFQVTWDCADPAILLRQGTYTVVFHNDGSIASLTRDWFQDEEWPEGTVRQSYLETLTVREESTESIDQRIQEIAAQALTPEQVRQMQLDAETVTEIPSNKMEYDKDTALGSGAMGWKFMDGNWFFKFGAINPTPTSLTLSAEYNTFYEETRMQGTIESGDSYWLERYTNGQWELVPLDGQVTPIPKMTYPEIQYPQTVTQTISWADSYGELPGGMYRLGNYYTFTSAGGETDTKICYAKFRIYDANQDAVLKKAKNALDGLLNAGDYHIYVYDWLAETGLDYHMSSEIWKNGPDYLEVTRYPSAEDPNKKAMDDNCSMWRGGKYYGLTWEAEPSASALTEWWLGRDGYIDDSNFTLWTMGMEWYDSNVEVAYEEGNTIHIVENAAAWPQFACTDITLTLDGNGSLKSMTRAFLPTRASAQQDRVTDLELAVFDDDPAKIASTIDAVDVSSPMPFSYAEDVAANPDAKRDGFKNTTPRTVSTPAEALALADAECTLPQLMEFPKGYCQSQTYYDAAADMWKVHLYWWQHDSAQTIYLDSQGVTQMIVTVE